MWYDTVTYSFLGRLFMRTRTITILFFIAFVCAALVLMWAVSARRTELALLSSIKEVYVRLIDEAVNASSLDVPPLSDIATDGFVESLEAGFGNVFCGVGIPEKVNVGKASGFWGQGSANVLLSSVAGERTARARFVYSSDGWRVDAISCAGGDVLGGKVGTAVFLYYYRASADTDQSGNILCSEKGLAPVVRYIEKSEVQLPQEAVRMLLRGELTTRELAAGISTEYPLPGVVLTELRQEDGKAVVVLADPQTKTGGGSCRVTVLRMQIEKTLLQFPGITSVSFEPAELFQP